MTTRHFAAASLLFSILAPTADAWAQPREASREVRGQLGVSINNAGLQNVIEVSWMRPASASTHPLLAGARFGAGIVHALTPAQTRLGGWLEYSPLSFLDIRAGIDPSVYFGTFNSLQGFDSYSDAFDTDAREARGGGRAGYSTRAYVAPTLKMKIGPIVASATAEMEWWRSNAEREFFYEPTRDTLLKSAGDRMLATAAVLMYQHSIGRGEFSGPRFGLPHPRLTLVVARYLDDPSKEGQWTAAAAVGFRSRR